MFKKFFIIIIFSIFFVENSSAKLPKKFRDNFSSITKDLCYSKFIDTLNENYDKNILDLEFEEVKEEYKNFINDIFNEAFLGSIKNINEETDSYTEKIQEIQDSQKKLGFKSTCKNKKFENLKQSHSPCRVAETILNEWCGYETYLWAKIRDDQSKIVNTKNTDTADFLSQKDNRIVNIFEEEKIRAQQALYDTLFLYKNYEQNYRLHKQLDIMIWHLDEIKYSLEKYLSVLYRFPAKFIDAASTSR